MVAVIDRGCDRSDDGRSHLPDLRLVPSRARRTGWRPSGSSALGQARVGRGVALVVLASVSILVAVSLLQSLVGTGSVSTAGGAQTSVSGGRPAPESPHPYVVVPGDTLWSIAEASQPHGDISALVDQLSAELGGRPLQAGERIVVP
jgi:LysM repeat protein